MLLRKMSLMMDEVDGYDSIDWCNCCTFLCLPDRSCISTNICYYIVYTLNGYTCNGCLCVL